MEILNTNFVPNRILEIAEARHVSIKELSEELGMPYSTFHHYASGRSVPKLDFFVSIFHLGINLDWFMTGEGEMYRANRPDQLMIDDRSPKYGKGSAVVNQSGINNGNIVTAVGYNESNTGGRAERICTFVRDYMQSHDGEDQIWLEKQLERAVPEYKEWKDRG